MCFKHLCYVCERLFQVIAWVKMRGFFNNRKVSKISGPCSPAEILFLLSAIGAPADVVSIVFIMPLQHLISRSRFKQANRPASHGTKIAAYVELVEAHVDQYG